MDAYRGVRVQKARISGTVPWCSGLAYVPVKDEIAGSNPVGTAVFFICSPQSITAHPNDRPDQRGRRDSAGQSAR